MVKHISLLLFMKKGNVGFIFMSLTKWMIPSRLNSSICFRSPNLWGVKSCAWIAMEAFFQIWSITTGKSYKKQRRNNYEVQSVYAI